MWLVIIIKLKKEEASQLKNQYLSLLTETNLNKMTEQDQNQVEEELKEENTLDYAISIVIKNAMAAQGMYLLFNKGYYYFFSHPL